MELFDKTSFDASSITQVIIVHFNIVSRLIKQLLSVIRFQYAVSQVLITIIILAKTPRPVVTPTGFVLLNENITIAFIIDMKVKLSL